MRELYRDPVYDGATDPRVMIDAGGLRWMFYTQRRGRASTWRADGWS